MGSLVEQETQGLHFGCGARYQRGVSYGSNDSRCAHYLLRFASGRQRLMSTSRFEEGLPASITMSLAIVANSLAKKKVLCKSLMTVETLGACDTLLSDKTGSKRCPSLGVANPPLKHSTLSPR
jgi:hypothetical protein